MKEHLLELNYFPYTIETNKSPTDFQRQDLIQLMIMPGLQLKVTNGQCFYMPIQEHFPPGSEKMNMQKTWKSKVAS